LHEVHFAITKKDFLLVISHGNPYDEDCTAILKDFS